jgi:hypothetical protein
VITAPVDDAGEEHCLHAHGLRTGDIVALAVADVDNLAGR